MHRRSRLRRSALAAATAVAVVLPIAVPAGAQSFLPFEARTVLPPGNSMLYTADGQAAGSASGNPDDFGENVDDQREMYWNYEFKDGGFREKCADPEVPIPGGEICWDDFGVPAVYGDTDYNLWYATGYAIAQIRLFLMDAVRRTARGTLSELTGPGGVPADVQTRIVGYTDAEMQAMLDAVSPAAQVAAEAYVDGANAWIDEVLGPRADMMPAEYGVLGAEPAKLEPIDVVAMGVLMTRFVASEGGREMDFVEVLRDLEAEYGTATGRQVFEDLMWREDDEAVVSVTREEGVFPRVDRTDAEAEAAFQKMADYAATLPLELADGPGTGAFPAPGESGVPFPPIPGPNAFPSRASDEAAMLPAARAQAALEEWRAALTGGSHLVAIAPSKTADGSALLVSEPQLGYNPTLLVELEVHGGETGYDARGVNVPGIPLVGIGYTDEVAWALTTGNSKTIDSFIETTRPDSNDDGAPEYLHEGQWKDMDCRTETVRYRAAPGGVPAPGDFFTVDVPACRTVHGPVVASTEDQTMARSVQYAMWMREVDTIEGVLRWNHAHDLEEFTAAMRMVTWNENTGYADRNGNIAFWHPGLHHERHPETDVRLPIPGTGQFDHGPHLPFEALPHSVNPAKGYVANWNNKPAHGWEMGGSVGANPGGHGHRVTNLIAQLDARNDWTFEALLELDRRAAEEDVRAKEFLPLVLALDTAGDLTAREQQALDILAGWDWSANGPGADMEFTDLSGDPATVGAAPTIFNRFMDALVAEAFEDEAVLADLVAMKSDIGRHVYDMSPVTNLILRILDPSSSSLVASRDYFDGRTASVVVREVLNVALDELESEQSSSDMAAWRSEYLRMDPVCSPTGIIGPCVDMPFIERGTWIHMVGYAGAGAPYSPPAPPVAGAAGDQLPATGGGAPISVAGLLLAGAALLLRRRRTEV